MCGCVCVCPHPARTCQDLGVSVSFSQSSCFSESAQSRYDMSAYILYQNQTIPEKWGGSLGSAVPGCFGWCCVLSACCTEVAARPTTRREGLRGRCNCSAVSAPKAQSSDCKLSSHPCPDPGWAPNGCSFLQRLACAEAKKCSTLQTNTTSLCLSLRRTVASRASS